MQSQKLCENFFGWLNKSVALNEVHLFGSFKFGIDHFKAGYAPLLRENKQAESRKNF